MTELPLRTKFENIEYDWFDCTCNVKCPYCGEWIQLEDEPKTCECGHTLCLVAYVAEIVKDG